MSPYPAIQAESLSKTYFFPWSRRRVEALRDLTLSIPAGSSFGLLGPNGAGKTTFLKILLGMATPSSGSAHLLGQPVGQFAARERVGYLPEGGSLPGYHTGRSFLRLHARLAGLSGTSMESRIDAVLEMVSMREWQTVRLDRYSKGMAQRLGLAQALLGDPQLLVLDEPTDGVDPVGRALLRDVLEALNQQGVTIFVNSHILAEVELFCRRVAILHQGRLALQGDVADLVQQAGYRLQWTSPHSGVIPTPLPTVGDHPSQEPPQWDEDRQLWSVELPDTVALNQAIDALRQQGALIESVERAHASLEQVFLRTIRGVEEARNA